jgi:hypothetical protein
MPEPTGRTASRIEPATAWTVVTDAPLVGATLAREAGTILAWDEANQLYLLNLLGEHLSTSRFPSKVRFGAISDDGSLIALLGEGGADAGLVLLSADFDVLVERSAPSEPTFLVIDPHGRYLAVGSRGGGVSLFNRYGRGVGRFEAIQPFAHLCFIPDRPFLVGAAAFGMLAGIAIGSTRPGSPLDVEVVWHERLMSNVGRLAVSGNGGMVLASCYTHGIQRFDLNGRNEGSYHLGGTIAHAVPDYPGRTIAAATLEGELAILNAAGNVRWRTHLPRPLLTLEVDPLGRYVIHGQATGEITRLNLFGPGPEATQPRPARRSSPPTTAAASAAAGVSKPAARSTSGPMRAAAWSVPVVQSDDQAETAVLAVHDDPACIAVFSTPHRLQLYRPDGRPMTKGPDMAGVGRILRTSPGWLAAATDRQIVLYDLRRGNQRKVDLSMVEITHLVIDPDSFGLAVVQERDRIGRGTPSGEWTWKHELRVPVEDLAVGAGGFAAITTADGQLTIFDPAGEPRDGPRFNPSDPPLVIKAPDRSPPEVAWLTLSRRDQQVRGHDEDGRIAWDVMLPWEGWQFLRLDSVALVVAVDGRALAVDGAGSIVSEGGSGDSNEVFSVGRDGELLRTSRKGVHLICATLEGRVRWRSILEQVPGPIAAGASGVAMMLGKSLAWFPADNPVSP